MMLRSCSVPEWAPHLEACFTRLEADVNERPHYANGDPLLPMHIFWVDGTWYISDPSCPNMFTYAKAESDAMHPNTIYAGEWVGMHTIPRGWVEMPDFQVCASLDSSKSNPLSLDEIGVDYFTRIAYPRPLWFIDPTTGEPASSRTKAGKSGRAAGLRFCNLCNKCLSANNFVSQHLKRKHPWLYD